MKVVTAAIISKINLILLTRRKVGEKLEGYWEFPGGKIENGETPQQCFERELLEELGVNSTAGSIFAESIYHYEHGKIKLIGIKTDLIDQEFTLTVHDKAEWVLIKDLLEYQLAPADIPIAQKILEDSKHV
jgi:8-oxo-dGTP diphosphatase